MQFQHSRFKRHDLFTSLDNKLVLDIILQVPASNQPLLNMLYGLFDGYWYYGVESAINHIDEVDHTNKSLFKSLIRRIYQTTKV